MEFITILKVYRNLWLILLQKFGDTRFQKIHQDKILKNNMIYQVFSSISVDEKLYLVCMISMVYYKLIQIA